MQYIEEKKIVKAAAFYPLFRNYMAAAIIFLLLGAGALLCRKMAERNILFSGTASTPLVLGSGENFLCELSMETCSASGRKAFILSGKNGESVLDFSPAVISREGKRQIQLLFHAGGETFDCGTHTVNFDNPKGNFDFQICSEDGRVSVKWRERCDMYRGMFRSGGCEKVVLPGIAYLKLLPGCGALVKITKTPWNRKVWCASGIWAVMFFAAAFFMLAAFAGTLAGKKKKDFVSSSLIMRVVLCCGATVIFALIVFFFLPENPVSIPDVSETLLNLNLLNPEPGEQILYLTVLLSIAVTAFGANLLLPEVKECSLPVWYYGGCFLLWSGTGILLCCEEKIIPGMSPGAYGLSCALMLSCAWLLPFFFRYRNVRKYSFLLPLGILCCYILKTVQIFIQSKSDIFDAHHYSVVLHPLWQSFHGMAPLETYTTYGGYAFFALPFFKFAGLSSATADFFWLSLVLLTWFFLFKGICVLIRGWFWRCSAIAAVCGLSMMSGSAVRYVQYLPLRMIFPAALFCWIACRCHKKCDSVTICTGAFIAAAAVLWNPDSGIVLLTAWVLYLICISLKSGQRQLFKNMGLGGAACAAAWAVITAVYYVIYGTFPDFKMLLMMPLTFGRWGNLQLPLPLWGWWYAAALTYIAVLVWAAGKILNKNLTGKGGVILFTALAGCGLFGYYAGRSHLNNLWLVIYPAVILMAWCAERLNSRKHIALKAFFAFFLFFFMGWGVAGAVCVKADETPSEKFTQFFNRLCGDLEKITAREKRVVYCGPWEALIAIETKAVPAFSYPALEELIFKKDVVDYCENINSSKGAFWVVNMSYINKLAPEFLKSRVIRTVYSKIKRAPGKNEMLILRL